MRAGLDYFSAYASLKQRHVINTANKYALSYDSQNHLIHLYNADCVHWKVRTARLHTINTNFVLLSPF